MYFFSDSQATLQALNRTNCSSIMVMETIDILNRVGQQTFPSVCWVPGHMDIPGNERADELARAGSGSRPTGPEPFLPFTPANSKTEINQFFHQKHIKYYRDLDISDKGKLPISILLSNNSMKTTPLKGNQLKQLTWLFSGHSPLNYFQHKIGKANSQYCQHCPEEPETSLHFLGECWAHSTHRLRNTGHVVMNWEQITKCKITSILDFVSATNRLNHSVIFQPTT